ncbi:MAG: FAD-dependent oxidoreductase [Cryobacterium sp.]|nr:FAD-dependent oxidoreductase [Oligoflexia bacterium]
MNINSGQKKSDIIIVGGGVIGMSVAYELAKRGVGVTVIDKGEPGFGCSYGNAGWLTPCFSMPLPMPGMLLKSIKWMTDPESPLYIQPRPSWLLISWLTRFLFAMNEKQMVKSVTALTEISQYSLAAYSKLSGETGHDIHFEKKGLLMAANTKDGFDYAQTEMNLVSEHGVPGRRMSAEELKAFEPALTGPVVGGVYFPDEAHAEPLEVVRALTKGAIAHGAKILSGHELIDCETRDGKIVSIRTTKGVLRADEYVFAAGSWSTGVGRALGLNVPILGGKGYSFITKPVNPNPIHPLMLVEKKVAITPRNGTLRIAGTLELVNNDYSISPRRIDSIIKGARAFMNVPEEFEFSELWRGLRPCSPDGVPLIGYTKQYSNLFLATGHQMLGLQSAMGSARLAGDLILGAKPLFDPKPFNPNRF